MSTTAQQLLDRQERAIDMLQMGRFPQLNDEGQWQFVTWDGKGYYTTSKQTCTCPDHILRNITCKHMLFLILKFHEKYTNPAL